MKKDLKVIWMFLAYSILLTAGITLGWGFADKSYSDFIGYCVEGANSNLELYQSCEDNLIKAEQKQAITYALAIGCLTDKIDLNYSEDFIQIIDPMVSHGVKK